MISLMISAKHRRLTAFAAALAVLVTIGLVPVSVPVSALAAPSTPSSTSPTSPASATASEKPVKKATFGLQPVTNGKPDARANLRYGVTPGARFTDHIAVRNVSNRPYTLAVYATDAFNNAKGDLTLLAPDKKPTDAGSWITVGGPAAAQAGNVTVKPRSYVILPIDVRVPANASPGDHVGGVVADLTTVSTRNKINVRLHQRVGLRTFIRVAGDVKPALAIDHLSASYDDSWNPIGEGSAVVTYRLRNIGNVSLGANQKVHVDGLFGQEATASPPAIALLLPGASVNVKVTVPGVFPMFWMSANVDVAPLVPAGEVDPGTHSVLVSTHFWAVPWVLLGVIVALALGFAWWYRRRRRRGRPGGRHSNNANGRGTAPRVKQGVGT